MKKIVYLLLLTFISLRVCAQDPAPSSPTAVSPNFTWYRKIMSADTSFYGYSNGNWVSFARRYWVTKQLRDTMANIVHKALNETITGSKTYTKSITVTGNNSGFIQDNGSMYSTADAMFHRITVRNGYRIFGFLNTEIASFADNSGSSDIPGIRFYYDLISNHAITATQYSLTNSSFTGNIISTLTGNRNWTLPDATGTFLINVGTQTINGGDFGLTNGYFQSTIPAGSIGRMRGAVFSNVGNTNSLDLAYTSSGVKMTSNGAYELSSYLSGVPSSVTWTGPIATRSTDAATIQWSTDNIPYTRVNTLPANTLLANTTASPAAASTITYYDSGEQPYTGTIVWTGTTAPSGTAVHTYRWTQVGKSVTLTFRLTYTVAGTALTQVDIDPPVGIPFPVKPNGFADGDYAYFGWGAMSSNRIGTPTAPSRPVIKVDATLNTMNFRVLSGSTNTIVAFINYQYFTP